MTAAINALYTPGAIGNATKRTGDNGQGFEPDEGQLSCPVLRGLGGGNIPWLPGGLRTFLTGSDATTHQAPQPFKQALRTIVAANRGLSHKVKGSNNSTRARRHLARAHRRVARVRQAFHWDLARALCTQYDIIRLETLNLQGMKALWGRKVSDLGLGTFVSILHHVASKTGTLVQHIARWFPSTTLCSACHQVNHHITLRDQVWTCTFCGVTHMRDRNAAINIDQEGASSCGGEPVRLVSASVDC